MLKLYEKIEAYFKDRPVLFWIATLFLPVLFGYIFRGNLIPLLAKDYNLKGYLLLLLFVLILFIPIIIIPINKSKRRNLIRRLGTILKKLETPFLDERVEAFTNVKITDRFYPYEILEVFEEYNTIVEEIKTKWPRKFQKLSKRNEIPRAYKNDWVRECAISVINTDCIGLIEQLK